jgi:hypothetical protein
LAAVALLATPTAPVSAEGDDLQTIVTACEAAIDDSILVRRPAGFCAGYIYGVWSMMNVLCINEHLRQGIPPELQSGTPPSIDARIQAFLNWVEDHPEHWDEPLLVAVTEALSTTFPCDE